MTNNEYVISLQKKEKDLIRIANYHGISDCADMIQDLYFKLLNFNDAQIEKICKDGEPSIYVVFIILRNMILNKRKKEKGVVNVELKYNLEIVDEPEINRLEIVYDEYEKIECDFRDRTIIKLYLKGDTIRRINTETNITRHFVNKVIQSFNKKCRNRI